MAKTPSQWELDGAFWENLAFTVGVEGSNAINVVVSANGAPGAVPAKLPKLVGWVSDDSDGSSVAATAPTTLAIQSSGRGTLTEHVANKVFTLTLDDNGKADVEFGDAGADTWYLVIVLPSGAVQVSGAVTLA